MPKANAICCIPVVCQCPNCGKRHIVKMGYKPIVTPRIFCPKHWAYRHDGNDGERYIGSARAKHTKKRVSA